MATILIADDDAASRLLLETLLQHMGHAVTSAANGADALQIAYTVRPDVVLADLSMPALSGAEFVRALRKDSRTKASRIALYTATPVNAALRDFMDIYGVLALIAKPAEPAIVMQTIEDLLRPVP